LAKHNVDPGPFRQRQKNLSNRWKALRRDYKNRQKYGPAAPLFAERLMVPVREIEFRLRLWKRRDSATVVTEWPSDLIQPISQISTIRHCLAHWRDGIPWEDTGIYEQMLASIESSGRVDGLSTREELETRYHNLDNLYEQVVAAGGFLPRDEVIPGNFREEGGIMIHIGPDGAPYFGGGGNHRLAMAIAAGFETLPAQLGVVHQQGLTALGRFR